MIRNLKTIYLYRGNQLYRTVEKEIELYFGLSLFYRDFYPSGLAHRQWSLFVLGLSDKSKDDNLWAAYHTEAAARYFPSRPFLICDEYTWDFFGNPSENMIKMYEGDWVNKLLYYFGDEYDTESAAETDFQS